MNDLYFIFNAILKRFYLVLGVIETQFVKKRLDGQTDRKPKEKREERQGDLRMKVKFDGVREKDGGCGHMTSKRQQLRGAERG